MVLYCPLSLIAYVLLSPTLAPITLVPLPLATLNFLLMPVQSVSLTCPFADPFLSTLKAILRLFHFKHLCSELGRRDIGSGEMGQLAETVTAAEDQVTLCSLW